MNDLTTGEPLVSPGNIARYINQTKTLSNISPEQLAALTTMVNHFAQGVIAELSNFLYDQIDKNDLNLRYDVAETCRCGGGCQEWQLVDDNGAVVHSAESLEDWI